MLGEHLSHVSVARSQQVLDLLLCERFTNLFDFVFELCLVNFVEWILMQEFSEPLFVWTPRDKTDES